MTPSRYAPKRTILRAFSDKSRVNRAQFGRIFAYSSDLVFIHLDEGLSGDRAKFVDTFWNILKWDEIEKRLAAAEKGISFIL